MTTQTDALSTVYARSLFDLAQGGDGDQVVLEIADELEQLCELAREEPAFGEFLASPIIDVTRRGASLKSMLEGRVSDLCLRFMLVLNDKGRLGHLESIATAYDALVQEAHGRVEVDVFTAMPINEQDLEPVRAQVAAALSKEPVLHAYVDESMLGGIRLQIGDQLIDGSVSTRLRRLGEELAAGGGSAVREQLDRFMEDND